MVNPIIAAIISFFLPGIGQIIQGETKKGAIMFAIAIVIYILTVTVAQFFAFVTFIYGIYAAYDAYKMEA